MKKVIKIIAQLPKYTAYSFAMSMFVFTVIGLIAGTEAMSINMIVQMFAVCFAAAVLQMLAFSEICIKKMHYLKRLAIFMFPFLAVITGFAIVFKWFPMQSIMAWLIFIGIFVFCFMVSTMLFEIHFKITGEKYTGILNEYKNNKKG